MSEQIPVQEQEFTITLTGNDLIAVVQGLGLLLQWYQRLVPDKKVEVFRTKRKERLTELRNRLDDIVIIAHKKMEKDD